MYNEPGVTEKLENEMSGAWVQFAKTGDPGWKKVTKDCVPTKIFDRECPVKVNFDEELVKMVGDIFPFSFPTPKSERE